MHDGSDSARDAHHDDARAAEWLTYQQIAESRGISKRAAMRMVQRQALRRQPGNDGKVRILVPGDMLQSAHRASHAHGQRDGARDAHHDAQMAYHAALQAKDGEIVALQGQVEAQASLITELRVVADALRERLEEIRQQADELREAEAKRKGRGRWARLWAAWRGE
jgi:hypothetical protein